MVKLLFAVVFSVLLLVSIGAQQAFAGNPMNDVGDFTCYLDPSAQIAEGPYPAVLSDQFIENELVGVQNIIWVCASANKDLQTPPEIADNDSTSPFGIEPGHHLTMRALSEQISLEPPVTVTLENQFGSFPDIEVNSARFLISPADKTDIGIPGDEPYGELNQHWLCYDVDSPFLATAVVTDQFGVHPEVNIENLEYLCNPVIKQVDAETFIPDTNRHLACLSAFEPGPRGGSLFTPINKLFTDQFNQEAFGDLPLSMVCVDTEKIHPNGDSVIAGEIIPIEQTSLLLAGTQSFSFMIPVLLSGVGIGIFVVSRKSQ